MKNFVDYLAESAKNHVYVIKFAERPTEEQVDIIEQWLNRYDLKSVSKPKLVEFDHKDFISVPNREVYEMTVVIGTAVVPYILLQDLKLAANISEKFMVIRSENEPIERIVAHDIWSRAEDEKAKQDGTVRKSRLSTNREYDAEEQPPTDPLFGDQYNKKLLSYLAGVADARPVMEVEPSAPLFGWLKLEDIDTGEPHQDTSDFNAHIDTPKPVTKGSDTKPIDDKYMNSRGSLSDNAIKSVKFFKDPKTGKDKSVSQPVEKN